MSAERLGETVFVLPCDGVMGAAALGVSVASAEADTATLDVMVSVEGNSL